jgi:hypothetical protein
MRYYNKRLQLWIITLLFLFGFLARSSLVGKLTFDDEGAYTYEAIINAYNLRENVPLFPMANYIYTPPEFDIPEDYYSRLTLSIEEKRKYDALKNDPRVKKIKKLYHNYGSPLESKAEYMVAVSDRFGIDYRLVPAISIVESSGGLYTYRPYNAWGWGGQGGAFTFSSWEESIWVVTKGIKEGYWDYGARTPYQMARSYCPPTWQSWAGKVTYVLNLIDSY